MNFNENQSNLIDLPKRKIRSCRDFFTVQLAPHKLEFGHVCENPDEWEQRYERKDLKNHRDQGKVIFVPSPQLPIPNNTHGSFCSFLFFLCPSLGGCGGDLTNQPTNY